MLAAQQVRNSISGKDFHISSDQLTLVIGCRWGMKFYTITINHYMNQSGLHGSCHYYFLLNVARMHAKSLELGDVADESGSCFFQLIETFREWWRIMVMKLGHGMVEICMWERAQAASLKRTCVKPYETWDIFRINSYRILPTATGCHQLADSPHAQIDFTTVDGPMFRELHLRKPIS